ncbi:hypothetical protein [Bradyrhizobium algeriense]|uniref:hypothetical protein n=1 Tax=Bradyrhizobium algeriense TaxID=634784 RepID=UPI0011AE9D8C|nr:hypothetical protein [Bradyrhizobium algeriense]
MVEETVYKWREGSSKFVDAYIDWVRDTAKRVLYPNDELRSVPILVSLQPGKTKREFFERLQRASGKLDDMGIGSDLKYEQFTLNMPDEAFERLQGDSSIDQLIHRITIAHKLPRHAMREDRPLPKPQHSVGKYEPRKGSPVVMGIIDEGIAFANQRFRRGPGSSRVEYAWIQDGRVEGDVPYGLELTKAKIDKSLGECLNAGQVDEDLFYSATGVVDFGQSAHKAAARRAGHGTHVMDLACGYDEGSSPTGEEGKDQRPIVCVKLPTVTVADTSGLGLEYYVLDGIDYILGRAHDIARERECGELPVVINFSSGILAGPRDGTQPIELAIDARIEGRAAPTDVVLPSGNSRLSRLHAKILLSPSGQKDDERKLQFCVLPDDRTCSYLEIWLPARDETWPKYWMELSLTPPGGQESELSLVAGTDKRAMEWGSNGNVLCKVYYEFIGPPTNRGRYVIALLPTALPDAEQQLAPFGTWTIGFRNRLDQQINVEASIQWDDRPLGYPQNGRQSYFVDDRYQRFEEISGREVEVDNDSMIKRDGSINAIATGSHTIVAGGYLRKENKVVKYSSGGPISPASYAAQVANRQGPVALAPKEPDDLERTGPDAMAWSDESYVHRGILAAGTRSGSRVVMNGTSVAAPQIARVIAERRAMGDLRSGRKIVLRPPKLGSRAMTEQPNQIGGSAQTSRERIGSGLVVTPGIERQDRLDGLDERALSSPEQALAWKTP